MDNNVDYNNKHENPIRFGLQDGLRGIVFGGIDQWNHLGQECIKTLKRDIQSIMAGLLLSIILENLKKSD
jgi:hypothetical protein